MPCCKCNGSNARCKGCSCARKKIVCSDCYPCRRGKCMNLISSSKLYPTQRIRHRNRFLRIIRLQIPHRRAATPSTNTFTAFTAAARNASSSFTAAGHNPYVSSTAFTTRIVAAIPAEPFFPPLLQPPLASTYLQQELHFPAFPQQAPTQSNYEVSLPSTSHQTFPSSTSHQDLPSGPTSSPHQASSAGPSSPSTSHQATSSGPSSSLQASSSGLSTIRKQCIVEGCPAHIAPSMWHNHMTLHAKGALPGIVPSKWLSEHNLFVCPSCSQLVSNSRHASHLRQCSQRCIAPVSLQQPVSIPCSDDSQDLPTFDQVYQLNHPTLRYIPAKARPALQEPFHHP